MLMRPGIEIPAAEAVKAFKRKPLVQTATPTRLPYKSDVGKGKVRDAFIVKDEELTAAHVLAAKRYDDRVVIVTIDGKRHEAPLRASGRVGAPVCF